jgi:autotransporter-like protein
VVAIDRAYAIKPVIGVLMLAGVVGSASPLHAQIFCPPNFSFSNGVCTFNGPGPANSGFSVAALSSEALSEVAQSLSQQMTSRTLEAVRERREDEIAACPDSSERVRGACRPRPARADRPRTPPPQTATPMIVKALPSSTDVAPRYSPAVWTQVFGDFEQRDHLTSPAFNDLGAKSTTWSVLSGVDFTFRNVGTGGDVLLLGLLAAYTSSDVHFTNSSTVAHVTGPSVGAYGVYVRGPFSMDLTFKADLFSLDESFSETIGTTPPIVNAGTASVDMTNFIVASNFNYRLPLSAAQWIEPTVGFRFTQTDYGAGAAALGLADGHVFRVQGGARVGTEADWNGIHLTAVVTGLAYSDVSVTGGTSTSDGFVNPTIFSSDQGKLRGEGIFALNFDYANGWSSFALADLRGGQDFFGYGGRLGLRHQW